MHCAGIDIGSVSVNTVIIDEAGRIISRDYRPHHGTITDALQGSLESHDMRTVSLAVRTANTPDILTAAEIVDDRVAAITAARSRFSRIGSLLIIGGEHFSMIHFDEAGAYRRLITNSSCAAGTGSFLDQQAGRLSLRDSAELSSLALENIIRGGETPKIASRCAVFAKTDLIHAQAEGYGLREICDGLCCGLAKNIADTLTSDEAPPAPIIWSGGVSLNRAVQHHLEKILQEELQTDETAASFGAIGAALYGLDRHRHGEFDTHEIDLAKIVIPLRKEKKYYYSPLELTMTDYPDFSGEERCLYPSTLCGTPIEVDIYSALRRGTEDLFLGIDIGSTSTKAVLMDSSGTVRAGFYTRTSGKPMHALRGILEAINDASERFGAGLNIIGAATTGSGRKFIGKVIGADLIVDEITAHAAAAYELNPKIDTIIEIGGQDSKFTTLKNGVVTFSQMNTICAAGTGSFIEEQASKLGVPLSEYSQRAEHQAAPLTSDRCTVFMERDINHYLNRSYSVEEVLAAALFSVRENYLQKVASGASLGKHVCFQGATAKNRALVAAFEQKIGRPIYISKYCHLTGALGAALLVQREISGASTFRGIGLFREEIPVRSETCTLCTNHCRIRIAAVQGEEVAFGFLCGRDYDTKHFVDTNRSGFDLVRAYRRNYTLPKRLRSLDFRGAGAAAARRRQEELPDNPPLIGIPDGLHLVENLPFWKYFFTELGFPVITSEDLSDPITRGKPLTGAEFCAPMTAYHGHANYIAGLSDILFLPVNLEDETDRGSREKTMRKYCYYTQYSSGVVAAVQARQSSCSMMLPLIKPNNIAHNVRELHDHLHSAGLDVSMVEVLQAYRKARRFFHTRSTRLHNHFIPPREGEIQVALLGRPYTVLSPAMNKRIPDIFASLGVRTYFQDMLPELTSEGRTAEIVKPLLEVLHWKYAARIIEAAAFIAQTPNLYPVYVSSFKCSPDSFTIDYFEELMEAFDKPYLILQLDEHDSIVGYETRIEAGVRAFRNHARTASAAPETGTRQAPSGIDTTFNPRIDKKIEGKTLLFPNWDPLTNPLLAANLRKEGIDARVLEESPELIHQSMQINNGQCLPVSIIAREAIEYVRRHDLRPADAVLWIARAQVACNIPMYPYFIKNLFQRCGEGMEELGVYVGELSHLEINPRVSVQAYFAYMCGGLLRRLGCQTRPYELNPGQTDRCIRTSFEELRSAFQGDAPLDEAVAGMIDRFRAIPRDTSTQRPKAAIFGDLYVRDNDIMNQDLVRSIEAAGGEVITTPYNEYAKIISSAYFRKWFKEGQYLMWLKNRSLLKAIELVEKRFYSHFREYFTETSFPGSRESEELLGTFNIHVQQGGESMENILKIFHILREHPDTALFVQAVPSYCCPAMITEAMNRDIERVTGVPVVSITYDGTGATQNDKIIPYLLYRSGSDETVLQREHTGAFPE